MVIFKREQKAGKKNPEMEEKIIQSIAFHENKVNWVQAAVTEQSVVVQRAVESLLPLVINYENLNKSTAALQIANHLKSVAKAHDFEPDDVRFVISGSFVFIKKILVNQTIPEENYQDVAEFELDHILADAIEQFFLYFPEYEGEQNHMRQVLTVAVRRDLLKFFQEVGKESGFNLKAINLNCFTVDELFRRLYPNEIGQTLLVNFTNKGYEFIISDEKKFLDFLFKPYSRTLQDIELLDEDELLSVFDTVLEEVQKSGPGDSPLYSISQIYVFGAYFKPQWLEILQTQTNIPIKIFNPLKTAEQQIISQDPGFSSAEAFRFVEPLSNLL